MQTMKKWCLAGLILASLTGAAASQSVQSDDFQQRMTTALTSAKKSADQLNDQQKALLDAINLAADPQQARKFLDNLIGTSTSALTTFGEKGEVMKAINDLLVSVDQRRKNAEDRAASDPRWVERVAVWKGHADNLRQLRQDLLKEVDRAENTLTQLSKDRTFIEDIIASEGVERARKEMEAALMNLRDLGDSLANAVKIAEERNRKISAPAS
ncbi:hypothetical protein BB934_45615 (plasmid) [Microvirga ossetica]|uniref:Uncharacterized protein n=1 Tax=Microvirga ossetica TaxID=1882682 RepID=A0A1B2EZU9_9HYPH|nr:hypothetical protein [Microvirga ossetica]ANY85501.1 hypothetical protein BB934_45615 [Microvirga ossetica]